DYRNGGRPGILVGNFALEGLTLHEQQGGIFKDEAPRAGLTRPSLPFLTFGLFFFDYDLDGLLDILSANGHIDETTVEYLERTVTYEQRPLLFRNNGGGAFAEVGLNSGRALGKRIVGRGAAYADIDRDGDLDVLLTQNGGPAILLRNDGGNRNQWLRAALIGTKSNRDGIGATITVTTGGVRQQRLVKTGSSYLSQSELTATFGLGKAKQADEVTVAWPSGIVDRLEAVAANQELIIKEGSTGHPPAP
ncbi:MAG: CRTAC1 family protein, partial [Nitrospirota bacterium]